MLSAGRPPFPPLPLHGRSTAAPSLLSPSVAARFISPSFSPCGGTIQPVLSVAEWIVPSCAQCPPNAPSAHLSFRAEQAEFFFSFAPAKGRPAQRGISLLPSLLYLPRHPAPSVIPTVAEGSLFSFCSACACPAG